MAQLGKESACNTEDMGSILRSERSPGGGHGNPLQYSCMENPMDRGTWEVTAHGIAESDTTEETKHCGGGGLEVMEGGGNQRGLLLLLLSRFSHV